MIRRSVLFLAISVIATSATPVFAGSQQGRVAPGAVYTMSNDASGNAILVFARRADGRLEPADAVDTGGLGSGSGLGNQGALALTASERWLLAVNAGSDTVSVLRVNEDSLRLIDTQKSNGTLPISVTVHGDLVYVLNGGSDSIAGFRLGAQGKLDPLKNSVRRLDVGTQPAEIAFSPDGKFLLVTEKGPSKIVTFPVGGDGLAGAPLVQDSNGVTPFGFAFGKRGQLLVSEAFGGDANASATSSYELHSDGTLRTISSSVADFQSANCWTSITPDGRFAYVTNTGSGTISGYSIDFKGHLQLLDTDGVTGLTGGRPIDLAMTASGRFLYSLVSDTNEIDAFRVQADGSLAPLSSNVGVPDGANGLAVR